MQREKNVCLRFFLHLCNSNLLQMCLISGCECQPFPLTAMGRRGRSVSCRTQPLMHMGQGGCVLLPAPFQQIRVYSQESTVCQCGWRERMYPACKMASHDQKGPRASQDGHPIVAEQSQEGGWERSSLTNSTGWQVPVVSWALDAHFNGTLQWYCVGQLGLCPTANSL